MNRENAENTERSSNDMAIGEEKGGNERMWKGKARETERENEKR
jgi:hypothetical protein